MARAMPLEHAMDIALTTRRNREGSGHKYRDGVERAAAEAALKAHAANSHPSSAREAFVGAMLDVFRQYEIHDAERSVA